MKPEDSGRVAESVYAGALKAPGIRPIRVQISSRLPFQQNNRGPVMTMHQSVMRAINDNGMRFWFEPRGVGDDFEVRYAVHFYDGKYVFSWPVMLSIETAKNIAKDLGEYAAMESIVVQNAPKVSFRLRCCLSLPKPKRSLSKRSKKIIRRINK